MTTDFSLFPEVLTSKKKKIWSIKSVLNEEVHLHELHSWATWASDYTDEKLQVLFGLTSWDGSLCVEAPLRDREGGR